MESTTWFSNRGQILQIIINALSLFISGRNAWKDLMVNQFFSLGALLFYCLVALVIVSFWWTRPKRPTVSEAPLQKVKLIEAPVTYDQKAQFKLKVNPLWRNTAGDCITVRLLKFVPDRVKVASFPRATLQVKHPRRGWEPVQPDEEIHVPNGDLFHAWIAPETHLSKDDIDNLKNKIGTLVLLIDGQECPVIL